MAIQGSLYLENLGFARKNILLAEASSPNFYQSTTSLQVLDPASGALVWQSPTLPGYVPINSLNFYDSK